MTCMTAKFALAVVIGCFVLSGGSSAQSRATNTGVITGVVEDPQKARIPHAKLVFRDQNRTSFEISSSQTGEFRVELPAGDYTMEVRVIGGFMPFVKPKFRVNAGDALSLQIQLEPLATTTTGA